MARGLEVVPFERDGGAAVDELRLAAGLKAGEPWAIPALIERHGAHVRRVLARVLGGGDHEQAELAQEVFVRAWRAGRGLKDPAALKGWLTHIAVFTARAAIRRRRRQRWLHLFADVPETPPAWASPDIAEAARAVYAILDRLPDDQRIPFALRTLGGMNLQETAAACGMSLATTRRRLQAAEKRFFERARACEALAPWVGTR